MSLPRVPNLLVLLPFLLVLSLAACATTSPPPGKPPTNPSAPAPLTALPSTDYSISAQDAIKEWRRQLKATPTM